MEKNGFNVTELHSGDLNVGVHLDTFIETAKKYISETGWVNIIISKNKTPRGKYTHSGVFAAKRSYTQKVMDSIEKKEEKW